MIFTDRLGAVALEYNEKTYSFSRNGKIHKFSELDHIHAYFRDHTNFDTIKFTCNGQKHYAHFWDKEVEVYSTKKGLRRTLSQEGGGKWIEEKGDKKRYFIEEKGWLSSSFKEVSAENCVETPSVWQKVLGLGLGILALAPGAVEFARHIPKETGLGLLAQQQKSPILGIVGYLYFPSSADAQAMGTEFQVNTYTASAQYNPSVESLNDGGFVVIWVSTLQDGDLLGIYGQRYHATGARAGTEFQVNTYTTDRQSFPSVASLNDGGFIVTWQSQGQDGDNYGIYGQRYDASGARAGTEFLVNSNTTGPQFEPSVAPLNDGGFVVTWDSFQDAGTYGIYGQRYNASGVQTGTEFQVNTYTTNHQQYTSVALLNDGGVVVTWQSNGQDGDLNGIYGQRYNATGARAGTEFQVNTYTTGEQRYPRVAPLNDGGFVVTWESSNQDGDLYGIYGQRYNASGARAGIEFQVNNYTTNNQWFPSIAPLNDGGFVVTWESVGQDGDSGGIYGQRYNATGAQAGTEFQVNTYTTSFQSRPSVALLNDGGFVVTWDSSGQDGSDYGIYGQRYDSNGNPVGLIVQTLSSGLPPQMNTSAFQSNLTPSQLFSSSSPNLASEDSPASSTVTISRVGTQSSPTSSMTRQISSSTDILTSQNLTTSLRSSQSNLDSEQTDSPSPANSSNQLTPSSLPQGFSSPTLPPSTQVEEVSEPASSGFPGWAWGILGAGASACFGVLAFIGYKLRGKKKEDEEVELDSKSSSSIEPNPPSNTSSVNLGAFPGTLRGTYYQAIATSKKSHSQYVSFPQEISLRKEAYTQIGGKYDLLTKINRKEAESLYYQTGVAIPFPEGKNKTKALLGDGNFSKVRIAKFANKNLYVAVKKIKGKAEIKASRQEGKLQKKFESKPNILPIYDVMETTDSQDQPVLYQFMMLAGFGDGETLRDHIHTSGFSLEVVQKILVDVAQGLLTGLSHMHEKKIYHLDFKPGNILFNMAGEAYVSDFGCALEIPSGKIQEVVQGDSKYSSPERLAFYRRYSSQELPEPISAAAQDAWALGVCLLELMRGAYPFDETTDWRQSIARDAVYFEKKFAAIPELKNPGPGSLDDIVKRLLQTDPEARLDIDEALGELNQIETFSSPKERAKLFAAMKGLEIVDPDN